MTLRRLIINADDFGYNRDINSGIVQAHREGVLTSTTLMANGAAFDDAVRLARETPTLGVGVHLVLVGLDSLLDGRTQPKTPRALLGALARREIDVYAELKAQIEKVRAAGIEPTHLDSHKHTHLVPSVFQTVVELAREFGIGWVRLPPTPKAAESYYRRAARRYGIKLPDHFLGFRLTGKLDETTFAHALSRVKEGTSEFMCHPGVLGEELQAAATRLKESRQRELEALLSPRIPRIIAERGIELTPF